MEVLEEMKCGRLKPLAAGQWMVYPTPVALQQQF